MIGEYYQEPDLDGYMIMHKYAAFHPSCMSFRQALLRRKGRHYMLKNPEPKALNPKLNPTSSSHNPTPEALKPLCRTPYKNPDQMPYKAFHKTS